jgi:hypothetical protein
MPARVRGTLVSMASDERTGSAEPAERSPWVIGAAMHHLLREASADPALLADLAPLRSQLVDVPRA